MAHELCHVRRRDNLAGAIHMTVEAIFWFHPLVWWLTGRLIEERERACDEEVLQLGYDPEVYAEGILRTCRLYLDSAVECVAGVTGADLRKRIEAIAARRIGRELELGKKLALAMLGIAAVAVPVGVGISTSPRLLAQTEAERSESDGPRFKQDFDHTRFDHTGNAGRRFVAREADGRIDYRNITIRNVSSGLRFRALDFQIGKADRSGSIRSGSTLRQAPRAMPTGRS